MGRGIGAAGARGDSARRARRGLRLVLLALLLASAACRDDPVGPPEGTTLTGLTVGAFHSCALGAGGRAWCWGANTRGQVGADRGDGVIDSPTRVLANGAFAVLSAGGAHTCGILSAGSLRCWGANGSGQLGDGTLEARSAPVRVGDAAVWVDVAAGGAHTCALDRAGAAYCWGANDHGQLGDGTTSARRRPGPVAGGVRFATIAAGDRHTCGIARDGGALCWGANEAGQLGVNLLGDSPTPVSVIGPRLHAVAAGRAHTCGLDVLGGAWCWGANERGALGIGGSLDGARTAPARVLGGAAFVRVSAGWGPWSCGLTGAGRLLCWGELRNRPAGEAVVRNAPGPVGDGDLRWTELDVGDAHACGTTAGEELHCWGRGLSRPEPPAPVG